MKRAAPMLLAALAVAAPLAAPAAADASFKLRPGQQRTYRCVKNHGRPACHRPNPVAGRRALAAP
jgi:hypothetical protein